MHKVLGKVSYQLSTWAGDLSLLNAWQDDINVLIKSIAAQGCSLGGRSQWEVPLFGLLSNCAIISASDDETGIQRGRAGKSSGSFQLTYTYKSIDIHRSSLYFNTLTAFPLWEQQCFPQIYQEVIDVFGCHPDTDNNLAPWLESEKKLLFYADGSPKFISGSGLSYRSLIRIELEL